MWLCLLLGWLAVLEDDKPKAAELLQGRWSATAANQAGMELTPPELKGRCLDITADKVFFEVQGAVKEEATYEADFSKEPVEIDLTYVKGEKKGTKSLGIMKLDGDSLLLVFSPQGEPRPQSFRLAPGSKHDLFVLTRTPSRNKGKLEGTKWVNAVSTIKGNQLPASLISLEFTTDGKFFMDVKGANIGGKGTYTIGSGDFVTLTFDKPIEGQRTHRQKIVIKGDNMQFIDSDGTMLNLMRQK